MGLQFTFCLTSDDTAEYERRLQAEGDLVILSDLSDEAAPRRWPQLPVQAMGKENLQRFLTQEAHIAGIVMLHVPARNIWAVDSRRSPVVEFSRCYYTDGVIRPGRAFFDARYFDDKGALQEKSASFVTWAKRVLAIGKKLCKRDRETGIYWGPEAAALRDQSQLELID